MNKTNARTNAKTTSSRSNRTTKTASAKASRTTKSNAQSKCH